MNEKKKTEIMKTLRADGIVPTVENIERYCLENGIDTGKSDKPDKKLEEQSAKPKRKTKSKPTEQEELSYFRAKAYKSEMSSSLYYAAVTPTARNKLRNVRSGKARDLYLCLAFNVDTETGRTHPFSRSDLAEEIGVADLSNYKRAEKALVQAELIEVETASKGWDAEIRYILVDLPVWYEDTVGVIRAFEKRYGKGKL